jgi:hypothetical protein
MRHICLLQTTRKRRADNDKVLFCFFLGPHNGAPRIGPRDPHALERRMQRAVEQTLSGGSPQSFIELLIL